MLKRFSIVSIDMFQTLVDVGSMRYHFWRQILGEKFSKDRVDRYGAKWNELFPGHFKKAIENADGFLNVEAIFEGYWDLLFRKFNIDFDPVEARRLHFEIHRLAPPYSDAQPFVDGMKKHFPVCLVTDSDEDMVLPHLDRFSFDRIFISERLQAYKGDPDNRMFAAVIDHYGVSPQKIIHIGDMHTDVLGAKQAGIKACWLNRDHRDWQHDVAPDYEIRTLDEAARIVGQPLQ